MIYSLDVAIGDSAIRTAKEDKVDLARRRRDRTRREVAKGNSQRVSRRDARVDDSKTRLSSGFVNRNVVAGLKAIDRKRLFSRRVGRDSGR